MKNDKIKRAAGNLHNCVKGIVGKSDFDSGFMVFGSIFPNFPEYFSSFSGVFFRIF